MLTNEQLIENTSKMLMNGRRTIETTSGSINAFDLKKILEKLMKDVKNAND